MWELWVDGDALLGISVDNPSGHGVAELGGIRTGFHKDVGDSAAAEIGAAED